MSDGNTPYWMEKLNAPAFYSNEKLREFKEQHKVKLDFEHLKFMHALNNTYNIATQRQETAELGAFIQEAYEDKAIRDMGEIHITDHEPRNKKLHTNNLTEDFDFYNYEKKLQEYNSDMDDKASLASSQIGKEDKRVAVIKRPDGSVIYAVEGEELAEYKGFIKEKTATLKKAFSEDDEEDEGEGSDLSEEIDALHEKQSSLKSLEDSDIIKNVFNEDEEYSFVKDYRNAFEKSLATPLKDQIFDSIPEHAFWDIKKPLKKMQSPSLNTFSPMKPKTCYTFWDFSVNSDWMHRHEKKENINNHISLWRRY